MITEGLRGSTTERKDKRKDNCDRLVQYINYALHTHNDYAFKYFFCEILNFANVVSETFRIGRVSALEFSPVYVTWRVQQFQTQARADI